MHQFAPVVPLTIARSLKDTASLGKYHLLLAHDVLDHPIAYQDVYSHLWDDPEATIILDNSLIELGYPLSADDMYKASCIIRPTWIVCPDVLGDPGQTIRMTLDFITKWRANYPSAQFMGVIQGMTEEEQTDCIRAFGFADRCKGVAIPRIITEEVGSRTYTYTNILRTYPKFLGNIHLLGFSNNILDDMCCCRLPGVMGIDSAVPIRAALRGREMPLHMDFDPGPRGDYWETRQDTIQQVLALARRNINHVNFWAGYGLSK